MGMEERFIMQDLIILAWLHILITSAPYLGSFFLHINTKFTAYMYKYTVSLNIT